MQAKKYSWMVALAMLIATSCETKEEAEKRRIARGEAPTGGGEDGETKTKTVEPPKGDKFGTGSIVGRVTVANAIPAQSLKNSLASKADCVNQRKEKGLPELFSEVLTASADGGLKDCVVYIKKVSGRRYSLDDAKEYGHPDPVVIDQVGCQYTPHVLAAFKGQDLLVKNSDPFLHNVAVASKGINISMNTIEEKTIAGLFNKAGSGAAFACSVHPWMNAKSMVLETPFFTVTDADGKFEINKLPAGSYKVEVYHEATSIGLVGRIKAQTIEVADGQKVDGVEFKGKVN